MEIYKDFNSDVDQTNNKKEFNTAVNTIRPSTAAPDGIHINTIKHLSSTSKEVVLHFFNMANSYFPKDVGGADIIPILKPNKIF